MDSESQRSGHLEEATGDNQWVDPGSQSFLEQLGIQTEDQFDFYFLGQGNFTIQHEDQLNQSQESSITSNDQTAHLHLYQSFSTKMAPHAKELGTELAMMNEEITLLRRQMEMVKNFLASGQFGPAGTAVAERMDRARLHSMAMREALRDVMADDLPDNGEEAHEQTAESGKEDKEQDEEGDEEGDEEEEEEQEGATGDLYVCPLPGCFFYFLREENVAKHIASTHESTPDPARPWTCPTCNGRFRSKEVLTTHKSKHKPERLEAAKREVLPAPGGCTCPLCGFDCVSRRSRADHMSRHHGRDWKKNNPGIKLD